MNGRESFCKNFACRVRQIEKAFDIRFALLLFLIHYCSINLIQSIGKVSKLPTYSKKSGNGTNKIKKKSAVPKTLKITMSGQEQQNSGGGWWGFFDKVKQTSNQIISIYTDDLKEFTKTISTDTKNAIKSTTEEANKVYL